MAEISTDASIAFSVYSRLGANRSATEISEFFSSSSSSCACRVCLNELITTETRKVNKWEEEFLSFWRKPHGKKISKFFNLKIPWIFMTFDLCRAEQCQVGKYFHKTTDIEYREANDMKIHSFCHFQVFACDDILEWWKWENSVFRKINSLFMNCQLCRVWIWLVSVSMNSTLLLRVCPTWTCRRIWFSVI